MSPVSSRVQLQTAVGNRGLRRALESGQRGPHDAVGAHLGMLFGAALGIAEGQSGALSMNHPVLGDWLENAEPARDDFWEVLRAALAGELDNYLANIHGEAVDTWIQHMNSSGESGAGTLVVNILKTAVGLVPQGGNIASAILGTVQDIYNYIDDQSPSNRVGFNDFVTLQARAHTRFSAQITGRTHRLFSALEALRSEETPANRNAKRSQALQQARAGRRQLPTFDVVYRALVEAWIRGAQDSWDTGDWGPEDAGYIYATCHYFHGASGFGNFRAFVDDVERPEGVITTIRQGWEPRGRVNLDELPFAMTITVTEMADTGTQRGFRSTGTTKFQKARGNSPLTFVSGNASLLPIYTSMQGRINASNLTAD